MLAAKFESCLGFIDKLSNFWKWVGHWNGLQNVTCGYWQYFTFTEHQGRDDGGALPLLSYHTLTLTLSFITHLRLLAE